MSESFAVLEEDFLRITREVVLCTVTTVDGQGRPRSRILHPVWEVRDGRPVGWVYTLPVGIKAKHLAGNPYVAVSYWSHAQEVVLSECLATWVEDAETKKYVFDLINNTPEPVGFDLTLFGVDSPESPMFSALKLEPSRVQVLTDFPNTFTPRMAKL